MDVKKELRYRCEQDDYKMGYCHKKNRKTTMELVVGMERYTTEPCGCSMPGCKYHSNKPQSFSKEVK
jgi:hypothetical protein